MGYKELERTAPLVRMLMIALFLVVAIPVSATEHPRRIAIAPFTSLSGEDVRPVATLLPRLLSSRLMALAGAEVLLLPADKAPEEAAREADVPLLLQGTVSRLGKGYSIDVTATDLAGKKAAGAFYAVAATEDEIIPRVGELAGDIAGKLFGVRPAARPSAPPAPPVSPSQPAPAPSAPEGAPVPPPSAVPAPAGPAGRVPSALRKAGQSDKIPDEIFGVVAGDVDAEGGREFIAYGAHAIHVYRVRQGALVPFTRVTRDFAHHFLNVSAIDLDDDGKKEIVVTDRVSERVASFVLKRKGDGFEEVAGGLPYYFTVLAGSDGAPTIVGQGRGIDEPFQGPILSFRWDGRTLVPGSPLPIDPGAPALGKGGILSLAAATLDGERCYLCLDENGYLRVLDEKGKSRFKSQTKYAPLADSFEYGPYDRLEGKRAQVPVRTAPRVFPRKGEGPLVLVAEPKRPDMLGRLVGGGNGSRLVLLQWEGSEFVGRASSPMTDFLYTGGDGASPEGLRAGDHVVASAIEQAAGIGKDRVSRLVLFVAE